MDQDILITDLVRAFYRMKSTEHDLSYIRRDKEHCKRGFSKISSLVHDALNVDPTEPNAIYLANLALAGLEKLLSAFREHVSALSRVSKDVEMYRILKREGISCEEDLSRYIADQIERKAEESGCHGGLVGLLRKNDGFWQADKDGRLGWAIDNRQVNTLSYKEKQAFELLRRMGVIVTWVFEGRGTHFVAPNKKFIDHLPEGSVEVDLLKTIYFEPLENSEMSPIQEAIELLRDKYSRFS